MAAVTNSYEFNGFNDTHLFSSSSGGWKPKSASGAEVKEVLGGTCFLAFPASAAALHVSLLPRSKPTRGPLWFSLSLCHVTFFSGFSGTSSDLPFTRFPGPGGVESPSVDQLHKRVPRLWGHVF